jgi:hypothetical protein
MPQLWGRTEAEATTLLTSAGFTNMSINTTWESSSPGTVISQIPAPGIFECGIPVELTVSLGPEPQVMTLLGADPDSVECGGVWDDPGAEVYGGGGVIAGPIYAATVEYQSGDDWIVIDPGGNVFLAENSPYRATYRYQYEQPGTEEPGLLEEVRMIDALDTQPPLVVVIDNPSYIEPGSGIPLYMAGCADYGHWDEAKAAFGIVLVEVYDLCEGYLPVDDREEVVSRVYPDYENPVWPGELYGLALETVGLDANTWLSAPGAYLAGYYIRDNSGNQGNSIRFVVVCDITETNIAGIGLYGENPMTVATGSTWEAVRPEVSSHNFLPAAGAYAWDDDPLNTPLEIESEVLTDKSDNIVPFIETLDMGNTPYLVTYTSVATTNANTPLTVTRTVLVED